MEECQPGPSSRVLIKSSEEDRSQFYVEAWKRPEFRGVRDYHPFDIYSIQPTEKCTSLVSEVKKEDRKLPFGLPEMIEIPSPSVIVNFMKCSFCSKIPLPDCLMCDDGHVICPLCAKSVGSCPQEMKDEDSGPLQAFKPCGKTITNARHQLITHVFLNSFSKCINEGCNDKIYGNDISEHESSCRYSSNIKCHLRQDCGIRNVDYNMYPVHLERLHGMEMIQGGRQSFLWEYVESEGSLGYVVKEIFHHCDTHFSLCLEIKSEKLNIWFSHFNSVEFEEEQFTGYIQLTGPEEHTQMYFGKIHGFRDRFDVVDRSWCLAIPLDSIPSFVIHKFGKPTLILDIFIHAHERCPQAMMWKPCTQNHLKETQTKVTQKLENFKITEAIQVKLDEVSKNTPSSTRKELCTEGFKEFKRLFDTMWKPTWDY